MTTAKLKKSIDKIAGECIAVRMRMLNRTVTNIYDQALRPLGVRVSQMNILVATGRLGLARPAEICERLHLDTSTLSRNVDRMRARGWLEVVSEDDGRAQPFRLTNAGRKLLEKAFPVWKIAQRQTKDLLGEKVVDMLDQAVKQLHS
jgi:DNA-binding MarR family transcriptional regulator